GRGDGGGDGDPFADLPEARPARRVVRPGGVETEALRVLVQQGAPMADLIDASLFSDASHREVHAALVEAGHDAHAAAAVLDPDAAQLLAAVAVSGGEAEPLDVATRLVAEAGRRMLADLERRARGSD